MASGHVYSGLSVFSKGGYWLGYGNLLKLYINGVAMGTKMGPSYANLFVGYVEKQIFEQHTGSLPDFFGRYIDDCLGTASCSRVDLERFINYVNDYHQLSNSHGKLVKLACRSLIF